MLCEDSDEADELRQIMDAASFALTMGTALLEAGVVHFDAGAILDGLLRGEMPSAAEARAAVIADYEAFLAKHPAGDKHTSSAILRRRIRQLQGCEASVQSAIAQSPARGNARWK